MEKAYYNIIVKYIKFPLMRAQRGARHPLGHSYITLKAKQKKVKKSMVESKKTIPFSPPDITDLEIAEVVQALKSGWITTGPKTKRFENETIYSEFDIERIVSERRKNTTFQMSEKYGDLIHVPFSLDMVDTKLTRTFAASPFVPTDEYLKKECCEEILMIQAMGLKKRLAHAHCKSAVVGISGGLDSTLALLVTAKAFDMLGVERSKIESITMPCFGTTDRTYENAVKIFCKRANANND